LPAPVQVTVKVALVVFGDIAPKTAADDAPLNPILPSWVNVHPGAVSETDVAALLLAQFTPTTTASLGALAEAVKVNVDPDEDPPCCVNTLVCAIPAQAEEHSNNRRKLFATRLVQAERQCLTAIRWPR